MLDSSYLLPSLICPACKATTNEYLGTGSPPVATSFEKCLRQCTGCSSVGASNTRSTPTVTWIFKNPIESIPLPARKGAEAALKSSLNERNRASKLARFGFYPTSEDAVSWVVFSHLLRSGELTKTFQQAGLVGNEAGSIRPELLLWGAAVDPGPRGMDIQTSLRQICLDLGESSNSLSEPDVIVDFGKYGVVFIEVKHRSGNDVKKDDYAGWAKYTDHPSAGWASEAVCKSGCYELARNWLLMSQIAGGRPGTLVNLGPEALFVGTAGATLAKFIAAIAANDRRRFQTLSWTQFRRSIPTSAVPGWLSEFLSRSGVGDASQPYVP